MGYELGQIRTDRGLFIDKGNQRVDVRHQDFAGGARGDGVRDDLAAIQAAIDSFGSGQQGEVFLPAGTYRITSSLTINDGVQLVGAGASNSLSRCATIIKNEGSGHAITVTESSRFWSVRNLAIQGQAGTLDGLFINTTCSHYEVAQVYLTANRRGIAIGDANFTAGFRQIWSYQNRQQGVYCSVSATSCNGLTFQGVFCSLNGTDGTYSGWYLNGVGFSTWISCAADQNTGDGFEMVSCSGAILTGTVESNTGDGFDLFECSLTLVEPMADGNGGTSYKVSGNGGSTTQAVKLISPRAANTGGTYAVSAGSSWGGRVILIEPALDKLTDLNGRFSLILDANGVRLPSHTDATRATAGTAGRVIFNSTDGNLNIDDGTNWVLPDGTAT